jgi:hypothetical protein
MEYNKIADIKERMKFVKENAIDIIALKKSAIKTSDSEGFKLSDNEALKALNTSNIDNIENGMISRSIVANTYNYLDSHGDVHVASTFKKSITDKKASDIYFLSDHERSITAKLGYFTEIKEVDVLWTDLGVNKLGTTKILLANATIEKDRNKSVFKDYLNGFQNQHSVGMRYITVDMAINDSEYKEEFIIWNKYIDKIANADEAVKLGYFFAIKEAALIEISAVLEGSNPITHTLENIEPLQDTQIKSLSAFEQIEIIKNYNKN